MVFLLIIMPGPIKLIECEGNIQRGCVLRCRGSQPYEAYVDFMLMEYPCGEDRRYALLVVSGYKAGLVFAVLPEEANAGPGITAGWLKANWPKWGYAECPLAEVRVLPEKNITSPTADGH